MAGMSICIILQIFNSFIPLYDMRLDLVFIIPTSQVRKPRFREVKFLAPVHTGRLTHGEQTGPRQCTHIPHSDAEVTDSQTLSLKAIKTVNFYLLRKFSDRGQ